MAGETEAGKAATVAGDALTGGAVSAVAGAIDVVKNFGTELTKNTATVEGYRIGLAKATGATSDFFDKIRKEAYNLNEYGIKLEKVVEINKNLTSEVNRAIFTSAQNRQRFEEDRLKIVTLIGTNEKFGASMDQTSLLINKLGNAYSKNVDDVTKFSDALLKFSKETGQPFNKVLSEFSSYSDRFVSSLDRTPGSIDKATKSFTTLETVAKRTGMQVSSLVGTISKFDDIDQAFSSGGQINRILSYFGGSFDTLAAANASDEERAKMLIESISSVGDKLLSMSNPQARRSILKEIESATNLPMDAIMGILNKNTDLTKDLTAMMRTPVEVKPSVSTYTAQEKKTMAMDLTTSGEAKDIAMERLTIGPLTSALERLTASQKGKMIQETTEIMKKMDEGFAGLTKGGDIVTNLKNMGTAFMEFTEKLNPKNVPKFDLLVSKTIEGMKQVPSDELSRNADRQVDTLYRKELEIRRKENETHVTALKEATEKGLTNGLKGAKAKADIKVSMEARVKGKSTQSRILGQTDQAGQELEIVFA